MISMMSDYILIFELIGTVAFAISGASVGLRSRSDLFGVLALGIVTATGGGVIRDLVLGVIPPSGFTDPIYERETGGNVCQFHKNRFDISEHLLLKLCIRFKRNSKLKQRKRNVLLHLFA